MPSSRPWSHRSFLVGVLAVAVPIAAGLVGACSSDPVATTPAAPDAGDVVHPAFQILSPMDGDLAEPADVLDLSVLVPDGVTPSLFVNDAPANAAWTADPTLPNVLHTPFTVPATDPGPFHLVVSAPDPLSVADGITIATPAPLERATGVAGDTDTIITLPSGARLIIPAKAIQGGGNVVFASYPQATIAEYSGATNMLSPVFRVHTAADQTAIVASMFIEMPVAPANVPSLQQGLANTTLDAYEGPDPDVEEAPYSTRADLRVAPDGSGVLRAELTADAFHHTGSAGDISGFWKHPYPFQMTTATISAANDADNTTTGDQDLKSGSAAVQLSNSGDPTKAHVTIATTVDWTSPAPKLVSPLPADPVPTSAFSALRKSAANKYRPHEGNDLRASKGTPVYPSAPGTATVQLGSQFHADIAVAGGWQLRYLHMSSFDGFTAKFATGASIGLNEKQNAIKAPADDTYGLKCHQETINIGTAQNPKNRDVVFCDLMQRNGSTSDDPSTWTMLPKGCATSSRTNCLAVLAPNVFTRTISQADVDARAQLGLSGTSSRDTDLSTQPHLHLEVWFGKYHTGVPLDLAYFYKSISDDPMVNEGNTTQLQSPVVRLAAQLDDVGPNTTGAILGIDPAKYSSQIDPQEKTSTVTCPYGANDPIPVPDPNNPNATTGYYKLVKVAGNNAKTVFQWDLGPCIYNRLAAAGTPNTCTGNSVTLRVGSTSWRVTDKPNSYWAYLNHMPAPNGAYWVDPSTVTITDPIQDALTATVTCCDGATDPGNCPGGNAGPITAKSFEGMNVTVQGINGEFATSTMTVAMVTSVGSVAQYQATHPNEAGGLSATVPMNAQIFTFLDNAQPAGVLGFPSVFGGTNFANRNGRSNLIAVWPDSVNPKKNQWVMNISGGSYTTGGGFPQWHEYQFVYDSRMTANPHNRYDVYLGQNAQGVNFSFIRTAKTQVNVAPKAASLLWFP